ncbi:hypothetical protein AB834_04495 [PVC group bacterium (ex Bugula neritina AB1)]|nr:hypothetical protein AB834_04495 [PVC group bacterium (ex Bugula neritina AB1)]
MVKYQTFVRSLAIYVFFVFMQGHLWSLSKNGFTSLLDIKKYETLLDEERKEQERKENLRLKAELLKIENEKKRRAAEKKEMEKQVILVEKPSLEEGEKNESIFDATPSFFENMEDSSQGDDDYEGEGERSSNLFQGGGDYKGEGERSFNSFDVPGEGSDDNFALLKKDLFGKDDEIISDKVESSSLYSLSGVVVSDTWKKAIINGNIYKIGDKIDQDSKVVNIALDSVLIRRKGETLKVSVPMMKVTTKVFGSEDGWDEEDSLGGTFTHVENSNKSKPMDFMVHD